MTENQETFTRAEVEALLKTLHEQNIQAIRDHYADERARNGRVARLAVVILGVIAAILWGAILWG